MYELSIAAARAAARRSRPPPPRPAPPALATQARGSAASSARSAAPARPRRRRRARAAARRRTCPAARRRRRRARARGAAAPAGTPRAGGAGAGDAAVPRGRRGRSPARRARAARRADPADRGRGARADRAHPELMRPDPHARPSARALLASGRAELVRGRGDAARERAHKDMLCATAAAGPQVPSRAIVHVDVRQRDCRSCRVRVCERSRPPRRVASSSASSKSTAACCLYSHPKSGCVVLPIRVAVRRIARPVAATPTSLRAAGVHVSAFSSLYPIYLHLAPYPNRGPTTREPRTTYTYCATDLSFAMRLLSLLAQMAKRGSRPQGSRRRAAAPIFPLVPTPHRCFYKFGTK